MTDVTETTRSASRSARFRSAATIVLAAATALALAVLLHLPHGAEHWSADLVTANFSAQSEHQRNDIALIYITDKTLEQFPYSAPADRSMLADLIAAIDAADPKAIGIDFIFDRPTETLKDVRLSNAIHDAKSPIVLGAIGGAQAQSDYETQFLADTNRSISHFRFGGHHNMLTINDDAVRSIGEPDATGRQSFAEALATVGGHAVQLTSRLIAWLQPPKDGSETFLTLNAETVLGQKGEPSVLPIKELLHGRIVLIGGNFFDRDRHLTPFSLLFPNERYPGVFIHAQRLAQLIDGRSIKVLDWWWQALIVLASAAVGFWSGAHSGRWHLLVEAATIAGLVAAAIAAFIYFDVVFPYNGALFGWLAGAAGGHYGRAVHA